MGSAVVGKRQTHQRDLHVKITVDGQTIKVGQEDKNLIDVAKRAKIAIPCVCYHSGQAQGCCRACVVDVDGRESFACATVPADGMQVIIQRKDLQALRRQRLAEYRKQPPTGGPGGCCSSSTGCC